LGDSGYQGILNWHKNSKIPIKKKKKQKLSKEEKKYNRKLSQQRILIENVNRRIKRFRILSDRYRNKRKKYSIRMTILCALHNMDISF